MSFLGRVSHPGQTCWSKPFRTINNSLCCWRGPFVKKCEPLKRFLAEYLTWEGAEGAD